MVKSCVFSLLPCSLNHGVPELLYKFRSAVRTLVKAVKISLDTMAANTNTKPSAELNVNLLVSLINKKDNA